MSKKSGRKSAFFRPDFLAYFIDDIGILEDDWLISAKVFLGYTKKDLGYSFEDTKLRSMFRTIEK